MKTQAIQAVGCTTTKIADRAVASARGRVKYHEAGHAVVARLLGISVVYVTGRPEGKFRGGVTQIEYGRRQRRDAEFFER
jgi:ATP-dependent Zn protease